MMNFLKRPKFRIFPKFEKSLLHYRTEYVYYPAPESHQQEQLVNHGIIQGAPDDSQMLG